MTKYHKTKKLQNYVATRPQNHRITEPQNHRTMRTTEWLKHHDRQEKNSFVQNKYVFEHVFWIVFSSTITLGSLILELFLDGAMVDLGAVLNMET